MRTAATLIGVVFLGTALALQQAGFVAERLGPLLALPLATLSDGFRGGTHPARRGARASLVRGLLATAFTTASLALLSRAGTAFLVPSGIGWCGILAGIAVAVRPHDSNAATLLAIKAAFIFVAISTATFLLVSANFGPAWSWLQRASESLTSALGPVRFRATASALWIALLQYALFAVLAAIFRSARAVRVCLAGAVVFTGVYAGYLFLISHVSPAGWNVSLGPSSRLYANLPPFQPHVLPLFSMYDASFLLALGAAAIAAGVLFTTLKAGCPRRPEATRWSLPAFLSAVALVGGFCCRSQASLQLPPDLKLGLYCPWDTSRPKYAEGSLPGLKRAGMYGVFLEDMRRRGVQVELLDDCSVEDLPHQLADNRRCPGGCQNCCLLGHGA